MAISVTHSAILPETASYDAHARAYTLTRNYLITEAVPLTALTLPWGVAAGQVPQTVAITHVDGATAVTLTGIHRNVVHYRPGAAESSSLVRMDVTYEGHVSGALYAYADTGVSTERIITDLNGVGIGPYQEGTNRSVASSVMNVVENYPAATATLYLLSSCKPLVGCVNEAGWAPAILNPGGAGTWGQGAWLYLGNTPMPNRDGTYTITHRFGSNIQAGETRGNHEFQWYHVQMTDAVVGSTRRKTIEKIPGVPIQTNKIHRVAGVDTALTFGTVFTQF